MENNEFLHYRNEIIENLNKFGVEYKLVGGSIVQLIDNTRETSDLDLLIRKTQENLDKFIIALVECKFAADDEIRQQIYVDSQILDDYNAYLIVPTNPRWIGFHIDMCFQLGKFDYENSPAETHITSTGLQIYSVPYKYIAHMKVNVFPQHRLQDLKDIKIIANHIGVDPSTGLSVRLGKNKNRQKNDNS